MKRRLSMIALGMLWIGVACAPSPPEGDGDSFRDTAQLCFDGDELRAVFDTCASSCSQVLEATCTIDNGSVQTTYTVEQPTGQQDCTADCRLHDASCGDVDDASVSFGADELATADLPDCSELF